MTWKRESVRHALASKGVRTISRGIKQMKYVSDEKFDVAFDSFYEDLTLAQRESIKDIILKPHLEENTEDVIVKGGNFRPKDNTIVVRGVEEFNGERIRELLKHEAGHNTFMRFMVGVHKNSEKYNDVLQEFMNAMKEEEGTNSHSWEYYLEYLGDKPYKYMYFRRALNEDLAYYYVIKGTEMEKKVRQENPKTFEVMDKIDNLERSGELNYSVDKIEEVPPIPKELK